ncbi:hypothetical protein DMB38_28530 [Streptomyces sp. WAC 06738]|uniref:hypothetical protein n=1 Tax=Streptomyces sp. WAC 06738 TaxID=2203210 RepID=UPI000F6B64F8|nr:hypothetical protein [Streptomyces sp. WAC 06738]AZM49208.1 hypothetical protein DMB38_28530 [Streptomyces sp. WAC 06738]
MPDPVTLADDVDLAHLVDLLDILPDPDDDTFWEVNGLDIAGKLSFRLKPVLTGTAYPQDVDYLAVYVLKYLGRGNRYITVEEITRNLRGIDGVPAAGHAWVEDATRTAWALVTRYSLPNWRGVHTTPGRQWLEG